MRDRAGTGSFDGQEAAAISLRDRWRPALERVAGAAARGEVLAGWLRCERSDFVRFNHGRVRQAGSVERAVLELRLIAGGAQARHEVTLSGDAAVDRVRIETGLARLRGALEAAEPDPFLVFGETPAASLRVASARPASVDELAHTVCDAASGADLVGFYAGGPMACGLVSSLGHDHWHEAGRWSLEYSVYEGARDRAVKSCVSGTDWSARAVRDDVAASLERARILRRPALRIAPGRHRCYLAPRALADLVEMLAWGGFSMRAQMTGQSPLARLRSGDAAFDARVNIAEDLDAAQAPRFQADGFARPGRLELVRDGRYAASLAAPRSAREFGVDHNGAADAESPEALSVAPGDLDEAQALARLGTGLAVSNLWYLNYSDRAHCRITGMTRFATLWVENGEPVAAVEPMRFDDSLYRVLGTSLEALTAHARAMPDTSSYEWRSFGATRAPGALVSDLDFTL